MASDGKKKGRWVFCARVPDDDGDVVSDRVTITNPIGADDAAPAPAPAPKSKGKKGKKKAASGDGVDLQFTNTGAMDIVFGSDSETGSVWIKDVKSSRMAPRMKLMSMEVFDVGSQSMVNKDFGGMRFADAVAEVDAAIRQGADQGISPFHLRFEPDSSCPALEALTVTRLVRMESKHDKEVIDALEALDRGGLAATAAYRNEVHEKERLKLAMTEANYQKVLARLNHLETKKLKDAKESAETIRRVTAREQEESAAADECRAQLRELEQKLAKVTQDLKTAQQENETREAAFARQSGQLEAARKREVAAHEAQEQLSKTLMDSMDKVAAEESEIETLKGESAERGTEASQLKRQVGVLQEQKAADDKEKESLTVQLREANASLRQANERIEAARSELGIKLEMSESKIKSFGNKLARQAENHKKELAFAADAAAEAEAERQQLTQEIEDGQAKYSTLQAQQTQLKMVLAVATNEIMGLKSQREQVQQDLAAQIKKQEQERQALDKQARSMQRKLDADEAALKKKQAVAKRDTKLAQDADRFHQNQMATTLTDKIKQITALTKQVKQLQEQLDSQTQLCTEMKTQNERLQRDNTSDERNSVRLKGLNQSLEERLSAAQTRLEEGQAATNSARSQMKQMVPRDQLIAAQEQLEEEQTRASELDTARLDAEGKVSSLGDELVQCRRTVDELKAQHAQTVSQVETLERRSQMQISAAKEAQASTVGKLAEVVKVEQADQVEIEKLKADYAKLHGFLDNSQKDLSAAKAEVEKCHKRVSEQDKSIAQAKTESDKAIAELRASLNQAQANEKASAAKFADLSTAMMKKTEAHGTEAQAARAAKSKLGETSSALAKAERALAGEQRKVAELQLLQEQATSKSLEYTQKIGTLEPKLAEATKATEAAQAEAKRLASELRDEKSNHQVSKAELSSATTGLTTAQQVQPVLDETKRQLEAANSELAQTKEALARSQADAKALEKSKSELAASLKAGQQALDGDEASISQQASEIAALKSQVSDLESSLKSEGAEKASAAKASSEQVASLQKEAQKLSQDLAQAKSDAAESSQAVASAEAQLAALKESAAGETKELQETAAKRDQQAQADLVAMQTQVDDAKAAHEKTQAALNTSQAKVSSTESLLQAEKDAKAGVESAMEELQAKMEGETKRHDETKGVADAQLQELRLTIDRYAKEKAAHDAERDGFTDKITYLTRERMRIYARLAETQMVLLSKNKALVDATAQARKFRIAATLKASATMEAGQEIKKGLEADYQRCENELQDMTSEVMKLERKVDEGEQLAKRLEEEVLRRSDQHKEMEAKVKQLEDDCAIWRGKARHRHRPLEIPDFGKPSSKKAKEAKTKWLEEKALDDSLGFDEDNDKEVTVTFSEPPPLGFGLLNCKDAHGKTHTVVHSMKEGSPADKCPLVATGQVVVSIGGESMAGRGVQEVVATMHVRTNRPTIQPPSRLFRADGLCSQDAARPVDVVLRPGSLELKLIAYQDYTHVSKAHSKKGKKAKKK